MGKRAEKRLMNLGIPFDYFKEAMPVAIPLLVHVSQVGRQSCFNSA
jgi:hypothetical protein